MSPREPAYNNSSAVGLLSFSACFPTIVLLQKYISPFLETVAAYGKKHQYNIKSDRSPEPPALFFVFSVGYRESDPQW